MFMERPADALIGHAASGAGLPLQIADPQHQFSDRRGARIDFKAEELMRIDDMPLQAAQHLMAAKVDQRLQHLAL
jgi:hypothetical protein